MGRPKKSETGTVPTKERLYNQALELFALRGYEAVSVRDITRALKLNEATLYIHFKNKSALLEEIIIRFEERLLAPGFMEIPEDIQNLFESKNPADILIEGGKLFLSRADREILLIWRMLMISQYIHKPAKQSLEELVLEPPAAFFCGLLEKLKTVGKIRSDVPCANAGRIIAAIFFNYSFRSILKDSWNEEYKDITDELEADLRWIAETL